MAIIEDVTGLNNTMYSFRITEKVMLHVEELVSTNNTAVYEEDKYLYSTNSQEVPATVIDKPDKDRWRGANGRDEVPFAEQVNNAKVVIWLRDLEEVGLGLANFKDIKRVKVDILDETYTVRFKKDLRDFDSNIYAIRLEVVR